MTDKIYIVGNGNQAPYGIGETIDIIPKAHWRKIKAICDQYYNPPNLRLNSRSGDYIEFERDQDDNFIGFRNYPYKP